MEEILSHTSAYEKEKHTKQYKFISEIITDSLNPQNYNREIKNTDLIPIDTPPIKMAYKISSAFNKLYSEKNCSKALKKDVIALISADDGTLSVAKKQKEAERMLKYFEHKKYLEEHGDIVSCGKEFRNVFGLPDEKTLHERIEEKLSEPIPDAEKMEIRNLEQKIDELAMETEIIRPLLPEQIPVPVVLSTAKNEAKIEPAKAERSNEKNFKIKKEKMKIDYSKYFNPASKFAQDMISSTLNYYSGARQKSADYFDHCKDKAYWSIEKRLLELKFIAYKLHDNNEKIIERKIAEKLAKTPEKKSRKPIVIRRYHALAAAASIAAGIYYFCKN